MKGPLLALHKAQFDRLKKELKYKIFDKFPEQEELPYIILGEARCQDWSDKFAQGYEIVSTIHIWSRYPGRKEALEMMEEVIQALTNEPLEIDNKFEIFMDYVESSELITEIDGLTRHGIIRMHYLIVEK